MGAACHILTTVGYKVGKSYMAKKKVNFFRYKGQIELRGHQDLEVNCCGIQKSNKLARMMLEGGLVYLYLSIIVLSIESFCFFHLSLFHILRPSLTLSFLNLLSLALF
jgi:hypothetical protein